MSGTPIWIAGLGAVSAAGRSVAETRQTFASGKRNISSTLPFESSVACPTFQVISELATLSGRCIESRTLRLAVTAIDEALTDAGLSRDLHNTRVGVCLGTTVACQLNSIPFYDAFRKRENPPLDPVLNYLHANLAEAVAAEIGATGPRMTVVNACSSGTDAIGVAASWIAAGLCDVAIAGGADELNRVPLAGFWALGVMSTEPCAPFDRDRAGLNLGEGAGVLVLESDDHARRRERLHTFRVAGFGAACDGHHLTAPHPEGRGLIRAIETAMTVARVDASDVAFINAHGTATGENDRAEGAVIAKMFGRGAKFVSTKGHTGHTLGAAGGLEAIFTVMGLSDGVIPASAGFANADDDIGVSPVHAVTRVAGDYALSTSLAFGGNNAALLIGRSR